MAWEWLWLADGLLPPMARGCIAPRWLGFLLGVLSPTGFPLATLGGNVPTDGFGLPTQGLPPTGFELPHRGLAATGFGFALPRDCRHWLWVCPLAFGCSTGTCRQSAFSDLGTRCPTLPLVLPWWYFPQWGFPSPRRGLCCPSFCRSPCHPRCGGGCLCRLAVGVAESPSRRAV